METLNPATKLVRCNDCSHYSRITLSCTHPANSISAVVDDLSWRNCSMFNSSTYISPTPPQPSQEKQRAEQKALEEKAFSPSAVHLTSVQSVTIYFTNNTAVFHKHLESERIKSIHVGAKEEEYVVLTTYTDGDVMHGYFSKHSVQRVQYTVKK